MSGIAAEGLQIIAQGFYEALRTGVARSALKVAADEACSRPRGVDYIGTGNIGARLQLITQGVESRSGAVAQAPFPDPAHQTGRAACPHPAFGQGI